MTAPEDVAPSKSPAEDERSTALVRVTDQPPVELSAIVLDDIVPFPGPVVPILLDNDERRDAVLHAKSHAGFVALMHRAPSSSGPISRLADLAPIGVLARIIRVFRMPDERMSALVQLVTRLVPLELLGVKPQISLRVSYPVEVVKNEEQFQAVLRQLRINLQAFFEAHPSISDELKMMALNLESGGALADFVAQHLARDTPERLSFLTELDVHKRLVRALEVTIRELDLLNIGNRISQEIRDKVEKHQREFFLREQLKAIRIELGEEKDPAALAAQELKDKLDKAALPEQAQKRVDEELRRLSLLPSDSPETNVVRSYLEWIAALPWSTSSVERQDFAYAREVLDADHFGLADVKERILEFLAVQKLNPNKAGSLLCLAGPPGVGKTSLGHSIAKALGREFFRFSVGGMRDEAEIKGHRRTYIGAMPGRIIQGLRQAKTKNPVFMLDELDKIGSDWRGDPSSALLEVLDPAQNKSFVDHYLDLAFDLSHVMFIATCNVKTEIPDALRDRLEIIDLPGYIPEEKLEIALRYLLPRERKDAGLGARDLQVTKPALMRVVREYTHEAGVRELDRQIAKICRKRAAQVVEKKKGKDHGLRVLPADVPALLGPPKVQYDRIETAHKPGLAVGLAWTAVGGDVLFIEAATMAGKGQLKLTGQLGEVMTESATLAVSYVKSHGDELGIEPKVWTERDFHVHFPAGAVKKDGPSAGITITTALVSLLTGRPMRPRVAMTGEITLRGEVLPVGGIREKVVAARRAGVRTVILPAKNRADVLEIPAEVRESVEFIYVSSYDEVARVVFVEPKRKKSARPNGRTTTHNRPS